MTGRSIEQIEADDNEFSQGLSKLEESIKNRRHDLKHSKLEFWEEQKDRDKELKQLDQSVPLAKRTINKYLNPVLIKPAIKKDEKYKFDGNSIQEAQDKDVKQKEVSMNYLS